MGHRLVEGEGLRTSYDESPTVRVLAVRDGPVSLEIRFHAAPASAGESAEFTRLTFESVFEYRWIASDQQYFPFHPDDYAFALIEIVHSEWIEAMLAEGMYWDQPPGERFGGLIHEGELRHYRLGFNQYGDFDVICLSVRIDRETGLSDPT